MPRRDRRRSAQPPAPLRAGSIRRVEEHPDGEWVVQRLTGASSVKAYRCPGCDQLVAPGTPHVVAWPFDTPDGEAHRRHWHSPCWAARERRGPARRG